MRRYLGLLILPFLAAPVSAQIIHGGQGGAAGGPGGGFNSPGAGVIVDTVGDGTLAARTITAGSGITVANGAGAAGNPTVSLDTSFAAIFSSGAGAVSATGNPGTFYFRTTTPAQYSYPNTDTAHWNLTIPAGAVAGDLFQTSATDTLAVITSTDDNTLVSNGSTWEKKALPNCADSGGNHLNYDASTNSYSCGTSGSSGFDPSTTVTIYDDFVTGSTTSGAIGATGLGISLLSSGTTTGGFGTATNPGMIELRSHATNDNSGVMILAYGYGQSVGSTWGIGWDTGSWAIDVVLMPGANSTAITSTAVFVGLTATASAVPNTSTSGIWLRRDTDLGDTAFIGAVCDSSTNGCASAAADTNQEVVTSTITPSAGTSYRFRISQDFTGPGATRKISMRVNNETALTFCSSGCTTTIAQAPIGTALAPSVTYVTRTTTGVMEAGLDYVYFTKTLGAARY